MNIHRMALLCGVLKNKASIAILMDLLDKNKTFIFFEKKYNKSIKYARKKRGLGPPKSGGPLFQTL